ncbi:MULTISPECIES: acyltransferase [unclassified Sphingobacterium]|uniref:acyltransferase n=1 Tax=unclassified Sphingobacterium TaxID=2609468 RepID=UPI0025DCC4A1|nr:MULTISPECIES: acyltransferase [unclassified Sphingobacterium]
MQGRKIFKYVKPLLNTCSAILRFFPAFVNYFLWDLFSNFGGKLFCGLRFILAKAICKNVGDNVYFGKYVILKNAKHISIGNNVSIHDYCYIEGAGELNIGDNVSIAHNCSILTSNHTWANVDIPIKYNKEVFEKVIIENDVWVGCGVRILAGVLIKRRSIIAAGCVVNRDVESHTIVGGVPNKFLKKID